MAKTDWRFTDTVIPEDLNGIGEEINGLRTEMSTRFDHEATTPLTLQPGLQVVHAEKDARFKLGEVRGRTLVNLLGQMGSMDSLNGWLYDPNAALVDSTDKIEGTASVKGVISNGLYSDIFYSFPYEASKRYIALGEVKTYGGATARIRMVESEGLVELSSPLLSSDVFSTVFFKVPLNVITSGNMVYFGTVFAGENGSGGNIDALRIYEISDAEYQALDAMSPEQVALKYPFVPSGIIGVENPYVINTSGNLLPPFYEWIKIGAAAHHLSSPYETFVSQTASDGYKYFSYSLQLPSNRDFYLSADHNMDMAVYSGDGRTSGVPIIEYSGAQVLEFNSGTFDLISIWFKSPCIGQEVELFIKSPILTIDTRPQSFTPQCKSVIAFQTELYANPMDGSDSDVLFEQNGEYKKLTKWKKLTLDTTTDWVIAQNNPGFKVFALPLPSALALSQFLIKFNGSQISNTIPGVWTVGDQVIIADNSYLYLSISNTDSGWGDNYTPTQDEIKAYFNGWRMQYYSGARVDPFNGTGEKAWYPISRIQDTYDVSYQVRTSVPTNVANNKDTYVPYQLLYHLDKDTMEPLVTEGSLLLSEGDNMVKVGTGIVLRESVSPRLSTSVARINNTDDTAAQPKSRLNFQVEKILQVYKNSIPDNWSILSGSPAYGNERANKDLHNYDQSAAYSVIYIKLDKSPIQPITGSLAVNEKAQISDLNAGVIEALRRVSVVEMEKAEKDVPERITPTLLNGWVNVGSGSSTAGYYKDTLSHVHIRGIVTSGSSNSFVFKLPVGYRPKESRNFIGVYYGASSGVLSCLVAVGTDGAVMVVFDYPPNWVSLDGISFLAEH